MTEQRCEELWDISCVAGAMNVTPHSARTIIGRSAQSSHPFPAPRARYGGSPVWDPEPVAQWIANRPGAGRGPRPSRRQDDIQRLHALAGSKSYITVAAMAKWLGCAPEDLPNRTRRGSAPKATRVGAYVRYALPDIYAWLDKRERRSA